MVSLSGQIQDLSCRLDELNRITKICADGGSVPEDLHPTICGGCNANQQLCVCNLADEMFHTAGSEELLKLQERQFSLQVCFLRHSDFVLGATQFAFDESGKSGLSQNAERARCG